jgi:PadR family transcriptional regulator, regulatory protein PadR
MMNQKKRKKECPPCSRGEEARIHGLIQAMLLLSVGEKPRHGYELDKALSAELPEGLVPDVAVLYRILRKFEKEGFVVSCLSPGEGGPARKVYSLTPDGVDYLAQWQETVQVRVKALEHFLRKYEQLKPKLQTEEEEER